MQNVKVGNAYYGFDRENNFILLSTTLKKGKKLYFYPVYILQTAYMKKQEKKRSMFTTMRPKKELTVVTIHA